MNSRRANLPVPRCSGGGPWGTTWYGGGQYAEYYRAAMFGLGFNLGDFGAISFDVTKRRVRWQTKANIKVSHIVFLYAKTLNQLGTNFQLMGYRYRRRVSTPFRHHV